MTTGNYAIIHDYNGTNWNFIFFISDSCLFQSEHHKIFVSHNYDKETEITQKALYVLPVGETPFKKISGGWQLYCGRQRIVISSLQFLPRKYSAPHNPDSKNLKSVFVKNF